MKLKKYFIYVLISVFCFSAIGSLGSCQTSYKNYRKVTKKKRIKTKRNYKGRFQKKIHRNSTPVQSKYVIKKSKGPRPIYRGK